MNKSIVYIEIIDEKQVCIYQKDSQKIVSDAELISYKNSPWVILDSFYIGSKVFDRPVKDKRVLLPVITASFSDFLLKEPSEYKFSYIRKNGDLWVSWIESNRIQLLTNRFRPYLSNIIALTSRQLLLKHKYEDDVLIKGSYFSYILHNKEVSCLLNSQIEIYCQTNLDNNTKFIDKDDAIFTGKDHTYTPNLWIVDKANSGSKLTYLLSSGLILFCILLSVNSLFELRYKKEHLAQITNQQKEIFKKVLPNSRIVDPYAQIKAEYARLGNDDFNALQKLNNSLSDTNQINYFDVDIKARMIIFEGDFDDLVLDKLKQYKFQVEKQNNRVILKW